MEIIVVTTVLMSVVIYNLMELRDQYQKSEEWKRDMLLLQQQTLEEQNHLLEQILRELDLATR